MPARQAVISLPISQTAVLERFEAVERLSEPFVITADVLCEEEVDFLDSLGKAALITVGGDGGGQRSFSGLIFEVELADQSTAGDRYRLTLRPWLYALTRNLDFVIFQKKTVRDILEAVFSKRGCTDVDFTKLTKTYPAREYCVQYRESDFDFVSRLMEEEGIYYFFDHRGGRHVMVLCDDRTSHESSAYESLRYVPHQQGVLEDRLWRWTESVVTGAEAKARYRSFDFTQPRQTVEGTHEPSAEAAAPAPSSSSAPYFRRLQSEEAPESGALPAPKMEIYDFPASFLDDGRGNTLSETRMLAAQRHKRSYRGEGDAISLACGKTLSVEGHPIDRLDQKYLITGLTYRVEAERYTSGQAGAPAGEPGQEPMIVQVNATPLDQPWRAPPVTPKPVAQGPETATVVGGQAGETIYTDQYGRVKVRFHWDRAEETSDTTCWCRVASASADNGFGHVALPRIGQEVVVNFLNGNPDRPLVIGSVFNGDKKQPYALPDDRTRSVWRSHTIDGGADDYNEISMEDKKGEEVFNVQAQKDRTTLVKHDDTTTIKNNLTLTVQEGDEVREVSKGKRTTTIQADDALTVKQGSMTTDVKMGNYSLKTDLGAVTVEAMQSITLKVGGNSVTIDQTGVTIKGMMISAEAQVQLSGKAIMTQLNGDAMTQIKGGIVMIN